MNEVLNFINERMKVLLIIRNNQKKCGEKFICLLSQQEIAKRVPCGKLKVNQIIKELIEEGYIKMEHAKGHYFVTDKGYGIIKKMSLIE